MGDGLLACLIRAYKRAARTHNHMHGCTPARATHAASPCPVRTLMSVRSCTPKRSMTSCLRKASRRASWFSFCRTALLNASMSSCRLPSMGLASSRCCTAWAACMSSSTSAWGRGGRGEGGWGREETQRGGLCMWMWMGRWWGQCWTGRCEGGSGRRLRRGGRHIRAAFIRAGGCCLYDLRLCSPAG